MKSQVMWLIGQGLEREQSEDWGDTGKRNVDGIIEVGTKYEVLCTSY